ncbi:serine protease inhibitor 42Dd [Lucilia cuprina]|uniref:serine protease inhibitor 42Dd n=1 Tax=Lucilia cuprina TaxID=7375 RepID=UPI001F06D59B|nr:serine protease inhibitor 42Dd [Lucilia cuprina]
MDSSNNNSYETNFGLELFTNLLQTSEAAAESNMCISPFLLEALLSLVYLGSDGKTAEELKDKLQLQRFPNNGKMANYFAGNLAIVTQDSIDTQLEICSRILVNDNFEVDAQFKKIAENYFLTTTDLVKFENREEVLKVIRTKLEKCLKKSFDDISVKDNALALLLLAANFKNKWFLPFSAYRSGLYDFHIAADCIKSIPMMLDNEMMIKFVELKELDARVVELPYEHDDELSMLLILPNKRDGLKELELKIKDLNFQILTEQMQMESVQLLLPKFKIDFECSLRRVMEQMGFNLMFSEESNFTNLLAANSSSTALPFSDILHKASIEVNESGSEAAKVEASKPIVISNAIDNTRQKFFRADHPFFFAIRNREATFFVGHVKQF